MDDAEKELIEQITGRPAAAYEVRKEDNLYLIGPFWFVAPTLQEINRGNCEVIAKKFLVDYEGNYQNRVPKSEFTHKGIWEKEYVKKYGTSFDYYPRGRISWDSQEHKIWVNIPRGLDEEVLLPLIAKEYDFDLSMAEVKYTDPTSGNHYSFQLK